ncbi:uncharacterized protein F5891DRAFT_1186295 [Suillus fuscotomentosus]|uniref:Uncharacterized protein n=1 Tax=Suillus fuscotomentosus TaxID=1912939 RepID=A0AAD4ECT8_9AGAM|nr:uncharacterized protein F5891DRAFT_1186295 [Suillus fuscotomentosus]KAG1902644.1 hypothetical protein F5891DRAFT_1186295 [Suillus fuscotomentosus]
MSHIMQSHSHSDTDSDSDGQGGNPTHISIPAPSASKGELLEVLKTLQVQMQRLQDENKSIKEENKTLRAEKPKRKRRMDTQHELSVHEDTITIYARKYGMMMEMFPSSDLLNKKLPEAPTPFDSPDRYKTAATQDSAFLHELYHHFPESLHKIMESSYFSDMVLKCIPDARANEIKKLRGVAGDIFNLPSKYFTSTSFERATIPKIQQLLGVSSAANQTYKTFPPILFPGLKEDMSLKTVFGNWELLARVLKASLRGVTSLHHRSSGGGAHTNALKWSVHQITPGAIAWAAVIAIFLLSPDTEFSSSGLGKKSNINYKTLFYNYKKVLVSKWTTRCVTLIVANINNYVFEAVKGPSVDPSAEQDHASAINRALAALDMDSSESDHESDASAQISAALSVANPPSIVSATQSPSAIGARPDFNHSQPEASSDIVIHDAPVADVGAQVVEESTQNVGDSVSA